MPGRVTEGVRQCAGVYVQHSFYVVSSVMLCVGDIDLVFSLSYKTPPKMGGGQDEEIQEDRM